MKFRHLILATALVALAVPASATVKVYDADKGNGIPGDAFQYSTTLCPPIQSSPGDVQGFNTLTDTGGGNVTMTEHGVINIVRVDFGTSQLTGIFGPGSFVFVNNRSTWEIEDPEVAAGDTDPGGSVAWGVLPGWTATGQNFCVSSPQTLCTGGAMVPHGQTVPTAGLSSPTFDLGTWSFDASGNLAASQYITGTFNGGTSNRQRLIRGAYVGSSIPALPLLGAAALALGLAVTGARTVLRKK